MYFLMVTRPPILDGEQKVSTVYMIYNVMYRMNASPRSIMGNHIPVFESVNAEGMKCEIDILQLLEDSPNNTYEILSKARAKVYAVAFHTVRLEEFPSSKRWLEDDPEDADTLEFTNRLEHIRQGLQILQEVVSEEDMSKITIPEEE